MLILIVARRRLSELRHMEVEDRRFREMYVSGDAPDMSERTSLCRKVSVTSSRSSGSRRGHRQRASPRPACLTQRISVISTASSNTTSGIASDIGKLYTSFEESEGVCACCFLTCFCCLFLLTQYVCLLLSHAFMLLLTVCALVASVHAFSHISCWLLC